MRSVADLGELRGRRVLIRCDFNVPLDGGTITDDGRIRAALPTLQELRSAGAKVIVLAHLGRPKGAPDPRYSLAPVAARLGELLAVPVTLAADVTGPDAARVTSGLAEGEVAMLENVRFEPAEESPEDAARLALARRYAAMGDVFVSDGFGVVHRKQASVYDIATLLPSAAGQLVTAEVQVLTRLTAHPERPYAVVLGGAKVADKLAVVGNLLKVADTLVIGGGMAFTFLAAQGCQVGDSLVDEASIEACRGYLATATELGRRILLPVDIRVADGMDFAARTLTGPVEVVPARDIPAGRMGLDIGPASERLFAEAITGARTVFWNGPMGVFEIEELSHGTRAVARALTEVEGLSVVGGGDSAAAVREFGWSDSDFGHVSTGGGASLEYLEGRTLPGLAVLEEA